MTLRSRSESPRRPRRRARSRSKRVQLLSTASSRSASEKKPRKNNNNVASKKRPTAITPARVYKRWIFVSVILTLLFSWYFFPIWFYQRIVPEKLGKVSEFLFENALFKMLPSGGIFGDEFLGNITNIIYPFWQNDFENTSSPGRILRNKGAKAKYPVVLIPGIISTGLELWEGKPCAQPYFRQRLWGTLTMMRVMVMDSACWLEHLRIKEETGRDPDGIKLRAAQGLEAADFILPGFWVWARIIESLAEVGYDHNNLQMAAYDWRLDVAQLEIRDHYFTRLKAQIELLRKTRGQKIVIVTHSLGGNVLAYFLKWAESSACAEDGTGERICGGDGGKHWVNDNIHDVIHIGAPLLGVPKTASLIVSGEYSDTVHMGKLESHLLDMLLSKKERLALIRTWAGGFNLFPRGGNVIWGNGKPGSNLDGPADANYGLINFQEVIGEERSEARVRDTYFSGDVSALVEKFVPPNTADRGLRAHNWEHIANVSEVAANDDVPRTWVNPLASRLPAAPDTRIYCFYGVGKETERAYIYSAVPEEEWPMDLKKLNGSELLKRQKSDNPTKVFQRFFINTEANDPAMHLEKGIYHVDGDGTVPILSLGYMCAHAWKEYPHLNPAKVKTITKEYRHDPINGISGLRGGPRASDHVNILGNEEMLADIVKIAADFVEPDATEPVSERILSDVLEMARKIKLPI